MDPGPFFYIYYFLLQALFTFRNYYSLTTNKYHFTHHTFNPLLSANRWDRQPHYKLGQSILVVLCASSMLLLAQTPRHQRHLLALLPKLANNNLQKWSFSPTGRLNLGFILRENLLLCSSYLPLGVSQLVLWDITTLHRWWEEEPNRNVREGDALTSVPPPPSNEFGGGGPASHRHPMVLGGHRWEALLPLSSRTQT
jgi:hypothetical protein